MEKTFSCCKREEEWNYHLPTSTMPKRLQNFQLNSIDFSISCTAKRNVRVYFTKSSIFILQQRTFFWSSTKLFKDIQCFVSARAWHNLWFLLAQKSLSLSEMVFTIGLDPREREKSKEDGMKLFIKQKEPNWDERLGVFFVTDKLFDIEAGSPVRNRVNIVVF